MGIGGPFSGPARDRFRVMTILNGRIPVELYVLNMDYFDYCPSLQVGAGGREKNGGWGGGADLAEKRLENSYKEFLAKKRGMTFYHFF